MPSTKEIFEKIDQALKSDPSRVEGFDCVYQFALGGEDPGTYQVILKSGSIGAVEGTPETPQCTIEMDSADYKEMIAGNLNGTQAFMSGKLRVNGDIGLAMRLESVLSAFNV